MLQDNHLAVLTAVKENSVRFLRSFYTGQSLDDAVGLLKTRSYNCVIYYVLDIYYCR